MNIIASEHWIVHPDGRLFARQWTPADADADAAEAPLVLLHDSLGCVDLWRDLPSALCAATSRRVVAYDRLGFGRSDARVGTLSPHFVAEEAALFLPVVLDQLGIARFAVLGHSVGGGMAVHAAARWPGDCERLVTLAAQAFVEERTREGIRAARQLFTNPDQFARLARYHGDKTRWVLDAWIDTWLSPAFADWSLNAVLPHVTCPLLVMHGELDDYGSRLHPELIGRLAGGPATVQLLAGRGHTPHREQPDDVVRRVADFLRQGSPQAS